MLYVGPNVETAREAAARTGRRLDAIRRTLKLREVQAEDEHRRALMEAQAWEYERANGLPHAVPEQTPDERHAAEYAALQAQLLRRVESALA